MRKGILISGNWIIDQVKIIDAFPKEEKLVNILDEYRSNGGSAYNVVKDLVKLQANFPLFGLGLVGDDDRGDFIIQECRDLGVDTTSIKKIKNTHTSYTDVMTVKSTGKRTFFHQRGANAFLDMDHFHFSVSRAKIFHLGYLLLLDKLDIIEADGRTRASKVLERAKREGFLTSADIVSEQSERYRQVIPSSLDFLDYLFVNEYEAGMISEIETCSEQGKVLLNNCYQAAAKIIEMGVRKWVILHFPSGAIAVSRTGEKLYQPCINLPAEKNKGAVGAGDAFAAGTLIGIHDNQKMSACLKLGVCSAASSLFAATSSDGIIPVEDCLALSKDYGFLVRSW